MEPTKLFARLSAFGCGAVVAFVALVALEDVQAARKIVLVHTCASPDGTLKVVGPAMPCAPEEPRVRLQLIREEEECKEEDDRVARLERRLRDLEARDRRGTLRGRRVVAPFEVVMPKGNGHSRLLRIEEQNVVFYNVDGRPVSWIRADNRGGLLVTESASGDRTALIAAQEKRAHVLIKENNKDRVDLGRRDNGRYSLQVSGAQDKVVAGIGQSKAGPGLVLIANAAGEQRALMYYDPAKGGGRIDVANSTGVDVGGISSSTTAGLLQLADGGSTLMVEAGVDKGVGIVHAGPGMRHSGVGIVGLAPSYIIGKP